MLDTKKICVVGAGKWGMNHIRTLHQMNCLSAVVESNEDIIEVNIPTGVPLIYELDNKLNPIKNYYLGKSSEIEQNLAKVVAQGKSN